MNPFVNNFEELTTCEFWIDNEGKHPKALTIITPMNVVENEMKAKNGKWTTTNKELRKHALKWIESNAKWDRPLILH